MYSHTPKCKCNPINILDVPEVLDLTEDLWNKLAAENSKIQNISKVFTYCSECNRRLTTRFYTLRKTYKSFKDVVRVCIFCKRKKSLYEKYGVTNVLQLKSVRDKAKKTNQLKYGSESFSKTEEYRQKCWATRDKQQLSEKIREVWKSRSQNEREHALRGFKDYAKNKTPEKRLARLEKLKQTCRERYGSDFYSSSDAGKKRRLENPKTSFRHKNGCRYKYDNEYFDSSWELALWIYAKDHNEEIEREPQAFIYEFNGEKHRYYPDFKYKGQFVEIKGNHLLSETNEPESRLRELAKLEFAKQNNIVFLFQEDVFQYREYAAKKFSSWVWYRQFFYRKNKVSER